MSPDLRVMGVPVHIESEPPRKKAHSEAEVTPYDEQIRKVILQEESKRKSADADTNKRLVALEKKVSLSTHLQWIVGAIVAFCTAWWTYKAATDKAVILEDVRTTSTTAAESYMRTHLQTEKQTSLDTAVEALRLRDKEIADSANPPPLGSTMKIVAARGKGR